MFPRQMYRVVPQKGAKVDVLLVEDDELVREFLSDGLAELGLRVTQAATAEDVLSLADGLPGPTVLVTDINLPGSDGFSLAAAARRRWPGLRTVFMSGRPMRLDANLVDPRDVFLTKPFTAQELADAIRSVQSAAGVADLVVPAAQKLQHKNHRG
jgi:DNA-binding response OmpR family regulator